MKLNFCTSIKELKQNNNQVPYPKKDISDFSFEKIEHYSLKHLKLGKKMICVR